MATYACSDLHGRLDLLKQIQDFLQPDDTVYFLGDAGDRGPNPGRLSRQLLKISVLSILKVITKICW